MNTVGRCPKCLLPATYPGIKIENGSCNFCKSFVKPEMDYLGEEQLKKDVAYILAQYPDRNTEYDVAIGFSGGMDSTWLLWYATQKLNLRAVAFTMRHKYMPAHTMDNIRNIAKLLDVPVVFFDNPYLKANAEHFVKTWAAHPTAAGLISFCSGCRYGLSEILYQELAKHKIHILFSGFNQYEDTNYRVDSVMLDPNNPSKLGLILGYGKEILTNPRYLTAPGRLAFQFKEFADDKKFAKVRGLENRDQPIEERSYLGVTELYPFYNYINWNKKEALSVLEKLGWQKGPDANQAWRSDCELGLIRQYYYRRILGFNDQEVKRAHMLRNKQITLDDPGTLEETDEAVIRRILRESFDLDFDEIEERIKRINKE